MKAYIISILLFTFIQKDIEPENLVKLNVWNKTDQNVFIFHNEILLFSLKGGDKKENYFIDRSKIKKIYARTYDESVKWGPVDLTKKDKEFYWKLTLTKE